MSDLGEDPRAGNGDVLDVAGMGGGEMGRDGDDERPVEALSDWLAAGWVDGASTVSERTLRRMPERFTRDGDADG